MIYLTYAKMSAYKYMQMILLFLLQQIAWMKLPIFLHLRLLIYRTSLRELVCDWILKRPCVWFSLSMQLKLHILIYFWVRMNYNWCKSINTGESLWVQLRLLGTTSKIYQTRLNLTWATYKQIRPSNDSASLMFPHSMIFSHIDYCITSWSFSGATALKPIESLCKKQLNF